MQEHYVYILANKRNGTLYVGMTENITKRVVKHKGQRANWFAAKYDVHKLVYFEKQKNLEEAVKRERQLKKWRREWKIKLIEKQNPGWEDLFGRLIKTKKSGSPVAEPKQQPPGDRREDAEMGPLLPAKQADSRGQAAK